MDVNAGMDVMSSMEVLHGQLRTATALATAALVVAVLALLCLGAVLFLLLTMRARHQKVEGWLARELAALRAAPQRQAAPPPRAADRAHEEAANSPEETAIDLAVTINEMLQGDQPYNFIEALRALAPQLTLTRLTPSAPSDGFAREIILERGGDGLFASIQGEAAELYPNYSRFSATLDPRPLFDGARSGARIYTVLQPALLRRQADGRWALVQRGAVQMRHGK